MLCPLAKANAMASAKGNDFDIDAGVLKKQALCNTNDCGFWDCVGEQCSIVTIARELRNIRQYGTKARDWNEKDI